MARIDSPLNVNNKYEHLIKIEPNVETGQDIFNVYCDILS